MTSERSHIEAATAGGRSLRVVVLYGGRSAEHDISRVSASHVISALVSSDVDIYPVAIDRDGRWLPAEHLASQLSSGMAPPTGAAIELEPSSAPPSPLAVLESRDPTTTTVVVPVLHGPMGEDGTVQGLLELAGVPYVGSGVLASAAAMDKVISKQLFAQAGLAQARYAAANVESIAGDPRWFDETYETLGPTVFVKPANMGSSVGVSRATSSSEFREAVEVAGRYDEWVVAEEAVTAREVEFAVLGNQHIEVSTPGEIAPADDFYSYADKYLDGAAGLIIPAALPAETIAAGRELAATAYRALRCEGLARVDFFYEDSGRGWLINEINTMPGFTPISMYPALWAHDGVDADELVMRLIDLALERHERRSRHSSTDHL